jgi:hypothetical protein
MGKNKFLKKFTEWEYWPWYMFYAPNIPYALFLALKSRSLTFFTTTNPSLKNSGDGTETKYSTLQLISKKYIPKTIFINGDKSMLKVKKKLTDAGIEFPIIAKPNIGFRGLMVQKINCPKELEKYLKKFKTDIILQEFVKYTNECGIFYHRLPNETTGKITSFTLKDFPKITGDGKRSLQELIKLDKRNNRYLIYLDEINANRHDYIPALGETIQITDIGNHCKGTKFVNANELIDKDLEKVMDLFASELDGWYYGRLDVKFNSLEELKQGLNFKVLELNGVISEPTHILDPYNGTFFSALKSIREHWKIIYKISRINKRNGEKEISFSLFFKGMIQLRKYLKKINFESS